jgi:hypothetical protein
MRGKQDNTGHVFRVEGVQGVEWFAAYRREDGSWVHRRLGQARTSAWWSPPDAWTRRRAEERLGELVAGVAARLRRG